MTTVALASKSHNMKLRDAPHHPVAVKEKENRRRSLSAFTLHSNTSFDHPKRRSFTGSRRSFSYTFRHNNTAAAAGDVNSHSNGVQTTTPKVSGSGTSTNTTGTVHTIDMDKVHQRTLSSANKSRPSSRFFSSPQFSSSTPNLSPKVAKYIDSELRLSHRTVQLNGVSFCIPTIVYKCCTFIRGNEPVEGLFRMNGSIKQVNLIEAELQKNIDTCEFSDDPVTTVHDVAVVLKRWISKLDDGLITADVCNSLTQIQREFLLSDYPSEFDEDEDDDLYMEADDSLDNIDEKLINMDQSFNLTDSPTKSTKSTKSAKSAKSARSDKKSVHSTAASLSKSFSHKKLAGDAAATAPAPAPAPATTVKTHKDRTALDSCYASSLIKLPIENLHLLLYLLHFLHYLAQPEISDITKMHSSNLAKVFQLNFFKSVDLTIGTKSFSTEDLKSSYLINEELLTSMIQDANVIIKDLTFFLDENKDQMEHLLNVPTTSQQKTSNGVLVKKRKGSTASTKTNNTTSSTSRNASIDSSVHGNNTRASELSTTLESCEEKEATPVPQVKSEGAHLADLENLEKSNEDKEVIRSPNRITIAPAPAPTEVNHLQIAHSDRPKDTRGSAIAKKDTVKRKSFFGFFSKWNKTIPATAETAHQSTTPHSVSHTHTPSISPKERSIASQHSDISLETAKAEEITPSVENLSKPEPIPKSDDHIATIEETVITPLKEISQVDETHSASADEYIKVEEISKEAKQAVIKLQASSQPPAFSPTAINTTAANPPPKSSSTRNEKSEEIIAKLQQLNPSEETKQAIPIVDKREKPKSSKTSHEKSSQKRFSLFKFRRSS